MQLNWIQEKTVKMRKGTMGANGFWKGLRFCRAKFIFHHPLYSHVPNSGYPFP